MLYSKEQRKKIAAHVAKGYHFCTARCSTPEGCGDHNAAVLWLLGQYGDVDYNEKGAGFETVTFDAKGKMTTHPPRLLAAASA